MDLKSLRRRIGVVMQDGKLFWGDIYSNISIFAPSIPMDDAWEAARIASVADDIQAMPMGMHTIIFEGQGGISGGQRQRLLHRIRSDIYVQILCRIVMYYKFREYMF